MIKQFGAFKQKSNFGLFRALPLVMAFLYVGYFSGCSSQASDKPSESPTNPIEAGPTHVEPPQNIAKLGCNSNQSYFRGSVGGLAIDEELTFRPVGNRILSTFDNGGMSINLSGSDDSTLYVSSGAFVFPSSSAAAGQVFCISSGSLVSNGSDGNASLIGSLLGSCATATPVEGIIHHCVDMSGDGFCDPNGPADRWPFSGNIGGRELSLASETAFHSAYSKAFLTSFNEYDILVLASGEPYSGVASPVTALIFGKEDGPEAGSVYCAGSGSWLEYSDDSVWSAHQIQLTDLRHIGSCAGSIPNEHFDICMDF